MNHEEQSATAWLTRIYQKPQLTKEEELSIPYVKIKEGIEHLQEHPPKGFCQRLGHMLAEGFVRGGCK